MPAAPIPKVSRYEPFHSDGAWSTVQDCIHGCASVAGGKLRLFRRPSREPASPVDIAAAMRVVAIMSHPAPVTVIIVNYRTPDLVALNLAALAKERAEWPQLSVLVIDGGSGDGSAERISEHIRTKGWREWVRCRPLPINGGFGWANNCGIRQIFEERPQPGYLYLLNPDAVVQPGAIRLLAAALDEDPGAGAVGSKLLDQDGTVLGSAFRFPTPGSEFARGADTGWINRLFGLRPLRVDLEVKGRVDWVTGASVMFRPEALRSAGVFDEGFFLYFEEVELMHRLRARGWHTLHEPKSEVVHVGGASTGVGVAGRAPPRMPAYWYRSRLRYLARTQGRTGTVATNLLWLLGKSIWGARRLVGKAPGDKHPPQEMRDLLRTGLIPKRHDLIAHGIRLEHQSALPAWKTRR
jgi:N-acetylglucosaminyl-diphospho-decaprenol L-rhamnosyltransferase